MWGQIKGKAKIVIAKEVMSDLIQDLPSDLQVGLMVYGHRQKDDCNDVEELFPVADLDRNRLITSIRSIKPKGKTPITHSVSLAAEKMKPFGPGSTIILVSDGEETCGGAPCKLVAELKAGGIDFVMHVVGFGVKGAASEQLACIAKAYGGTYTEAADAGKLKVALAEAIEKNPGVKSGHPGGAGEPGQRRQASSPRGRGQGLKRRRSDCRNQRDQGRL